MNKLLLTTAALCALALPALAADLPTKAPRIAPAPGVNWSGFYLGVMGGYGWSDEVRAGFGGPAALSTADVKGGFIGGTAGYNWQSGKAVFGIEIDAAASGIKYTETFAGMTSENRLRALGSVTGRLGFLATDALLLYVKGGYGWADNRFKLSDTAPPMAFTESRWHSGWTVGGGAEWMIAPQWSLKAEYMYADFGRAAYLTNVYYGGIDIGGSFHTLKGGVNFHF